MVEEPVRPLSSFSTPRRVTCERLCDTKSNTNAAQPFVFDFPVELVRDIFEIAAVTDTRSALALNLVSHVARQWTEPALYCTVMLSCARSVRGFVRTIDLRPAGFFESRVQHLGLFAPGPIYSICRIITTCSGVKSVACGLSLLWCTVVRDGIPKSLMLSKRKEQHFLGISTRDGWDPAFVGPEVTHLRLCLSPEQISSEYTLDLFARLPPLTHLAIVYNRLAFEQESGLTSMLSNVLKMHPSLRLLLVQVHNGAQLVNDLNTLAESGDWDSRIVAERAPLSAAIQWEDTARSGDSIWANAEKIVKSRLGKGS